MINQEELTNIVVELMKRASIHLPVSVKEGLKHACNEEDCILAKKHIETILEDINIAERKTIPVCQDTGVPIFFVKVGKNWEYRTVDAITEGTKKATKLIPLRENVINPITFENSGNNTGWGMPYIHYEMTDEDYTEIKVLLKGFGSEAKTSLCYIATTENLEKGLIKYLLDCARKGFGEPCPPYIIGIGMGGTSDVAASLAKKAFLRLPVTANNPDPNTARLENVLRKALSESGIGAMGMGGSHTALSVNIETCGTHSAAVPIVVATQCWADRQATVRIYSDNTFKFQGDK